MNPEFAIDWLTLTMWGGRDQAAEWVSDLVGHQITWQDTGHGGLAFERLEFGPYGMKLYSLPVKDVGFCTVQLPGQVFTVATPGMVFDALCSLDQTGRRWQARRVDLRFDHDFFTPGQVNAEWAIEVGARGSRVRSTVRRDNASYERRYDGHDIMRLGSRQSDRFMRIYVRPEGHTRVELECKGERAEAVAGDLLGVYRAGGDVALRALGHVRAFVEFPAADWWARFVAASVQCKLTLRKDREASVERMGEWLRRQVAPTLAAWTAVHFGDVEAVLGIAEEGAGRMNDKLRHLVDCVCDEAVSFRAAEMVGAG